MTRIVGASFLARNTCLFLLLTLSAAASCSAFLPGDRTRALSKLSQQQLLWSSYSSSVFMAKPGMSDERARQEREAEIQSKISRLKAQGKMKNKDGTALSSEDSAMLEAEAFFNKPSPSRKWERSVAERKRVETEAAEAAAEKERKNTGDERSDSPE